MAGNGWREGDRFTVHAKDLPGYHGKVHSVKRVGHDKESNPGVTCLYFDVEPTATTAEARRGSYVWSDEIRKEP